MKFKQGFTLIELLVVIAIIGILASVVIASLNSARTKGREAAIKSNLKNMIPQAELAYDSANPNSYAATCAGLTNMMTAITSAGGTSACYSHGGGDANARWGASAKNSDGTKNWSVDSSGVAEWGNVNLGSTSNVWDVSSGTATMPWATANTVCAAAGGKLPSLEQLKALSLANSSTTPPGFLADWYWSSTTYPADTTQAYVIFWGAGNFTQAPKANSYYVRCVR